MNTRNEWIIENPESEMYYTASDTVLDVVNNFNIRLYSAEGVSVNIDSISEQAIIQSHSNPLNEGKTDKKIHVTMNSVLKSGSLIEFDNEKWLCTSYVNSVGGAYKTARIDRCNYNLKFLDSDGHPTSRWCIVGDSTGTVDENNYLRLPAGKYSIKLPFYRNFSLKLDDRLMIDYDSTIPQVYKIEHIDKVTSHFGDNGVIELIVGQDQLDTEDDNVELMICNYYSRVSHTPPEPTGNYVSIEFSNDPILYFGSSSKTFYSKYYNLNNELLNPQPSSVWTVSLSDPSYISYVQQTIASDTSNIKLKILDERLIGMTITLGASSSDGTMIDSKTISVIPLG